MLMIMLTFLGGLAIAGLSWRTFSDVRSHGFFRFLFLEALWVVFMLNVKSWFAHPLSWHQLISWLLLSASLLLALAGFVALRRHGKAPRAPQRPTSFAFEDTTTLVTSGPYRYIRHPLYTSLVLLLWGTAFKTFSFFGILFALIATGILYVTAYYEELENLERFGEKYDRYMNETKMFIPGVL